MPPTCSLAGPSHEQALAVRRDLQLKSGANNATRARGTSVTPNGSIAALTEKANERLPDHRIG